MTGGGVDTLAPLRVGGIALAGRGHHGVGQHNVAGGEIGGETTGTAETQERGGTGFDHVARGVAGSIGAAADGGGEGAWCRKVGDRRLEAAQFRRQTADDAEPAHTP